MLYYVHKWKNSSKKILNEECVMNKNYEREEFNLYHPERGEVQDYLVVIISALLRIMRGEKFRIASFALGAIFALILTVGLVGGMDAGMLSLSCSVPLFAGLAVCVWLVCRESGESKNK